MVAVEVLRRARPLPASFYLDGALRVAERLLGKWLVVDGQRGGLAAAEIVEVEAYLGEGDAASHSARGPTPRCAPMFEAGGTCYVYLSYGVHHCMNVVTGPAGSGEAVLLRAARPLAGVPGILARRGLTPPRLRDALRGPGRLTQGLGIDLAANGRDFFASDFKIVAPSSPAAAPRRRIVRAPRVGISQARDLAYRLFFADSPWASRVSVRV